MSTLVYVVAAAAAAAAFAVLMFLARKRGENAAPAVTTPKPSKAAVKGKEAAKPDAKAPAKALPSMTYDEDENLDDATKLASHAAGLAQPKAPVAVPVKRIVYEEDAESDAPTEVSDMFLLTATAQTDKGLRRKRNEDSVLTMPDEGVFVVADGMGGYRGGEVASELAVSTIERAFRHGEFPGVVDPLLAPRAAELVRAVQAANEAILARAAEQKELAGMGTTVVAARFSTNKERVFIAHVGDSRLYRVRAGKLVQITSDHTMKDLGVTGEGSGHLSRALGIWPLVPIDVITAKPQHGDVYMLCSDGLTKMVKDQTIGEILRADATPEQMVERLVEAANAEGGKDNITVIVVRVTKTKP